MFDNFDEEEFERERAEEKKRVKNLPIARKAKDLLNTILGFMASIEHEKDQLELKSRLFEDVTVINAKIIGAEASDLFSLRMENAVLIKRHANSILTAMHGCEMVEMGNADYIELMREEVEEFRVLFVEWVASFDRTNDISDEWGLFYQ